jgi:hypothetical protein
MQVVEIARIQLWNRTLWSQQKNLEKQFSFGDYVLWFPKGNKSHLGKFTKKWFGSYRIQYVLPNNTMLMVTIEKFETNPLLVNVNKLKPINTWNLKFKEKNNKCQYIGKRMQVEFKRRILT